MRGYPEVLLGSVTTLCLWLMYSSSIPRGLIGETLHSSTFPCGSTGVSSGKCAVDVIFVDRSATPSGVVKSDGVVCVVEECFLSAVHELWVEQL